jgi:GDPmannose 4,6-dehydratase
MESESSHRPLWSRCLPARPLQSHVSQEQPLGRRRLAVVREQTAIVTGATGQDGYFLVRRLLEDGWTVYAPVRDLAAAGHLFGHHDALHVVRRDLGDPGPLASLVGDIRPEEMYNLAGESSVAGSFVDPRANWEANAHIIVHLLDAVRKDSPETRFYQASSGEMFGWVPGGHTLHNEHSPLNPQSPYAAAKAAAHLLCRSYRESYDVRIACGILFNHESHRRGRRFLTRKVVDHVDAFRRGATRGPLRVGNLKARRDWGFAPDYVEGMMMILRQASIRKVRDAPAEYKDYVLGTGRLHHVWELIDRAFLLAGFHLSWALDSDDPLAWHASLDTGELAVVVDPQFVRPADPAAIGADPANVVRDLGWQPRVGLDIFLSDMLRTDAAAASPH